MDVRLDLRVTVPGPEDIDICYETCPNGRGGFLQCYLECTSPIPDILAEPLDFCVRLRWAWSQETSVVRKIQLLWQMMAMGCIEARQVAIQLTPDFGSQ